MVSVWRKSERKLFGYRVLIVYLSSSPSQLSVPLLFYLLSWGWGLERIVKYV